MAAFSNGQIGPLKPSRDIISLNLQNDDEDENVFELLDLDSENWLDEYEEGGQEMEDDFRDTTGARMCGNSCLAHLLQLAIKDALKIDVYTSNLMKRINEIVTFITKRHKFYEALKKLNNNRALMLPNVTRWNSQFFSANRIFGEKNGKVS